MRDYHFIGAAILASAITLPSFAGTNELFEAKTATTGIEVAADSILSNGSKAERKAKKAAAQANRKALRAYGKCPDKPQAAENKLANAAHKLGKFQDALADVATTSPELDALAGFSDATLANIDYLLDTYNVCDEGATLTQADDIEYTIDPGPFVNFGTGWGTLFSSAHGTFGDFSADMQAPDHVHSRTYYGIVISGIVKNPFGDMPGSNVGGAKPLAAGSFWSVPANAIHTTACDGGTEGANCRFYFHSRGAFDFSVDVSGGNADDDTSQEITVDEIAIELSKPDAVVSPFARMYTVWGDRAIGAHGTVGEFIAGGASPLHTHSFSYHGVVLTGTMVNPFLGQPIEEARQLEAGDYWFVPAHVDHVTACVSAEPCTFYFHSEGLFDFLPPSGDDD